MMQKCQKVVFSHLVTNELLKSSLVLFACECLCVCGVVIGGFVVPS